MTKSEKSVAIIGAGITGVTTAYSLLERGFKVTVFDRHRYAGMETSFANGGQLSASNAEVWNRTSTILKGIKWMFTPGAPLLVNPSPSWHKYSWMAEFMAAIPHYEKNTIETVRLAIAAREHLKKTAEKEGFDFNCEDRGILHIYTNKKEFEHAKWVNGLLAQGGLDRRAVTAEEAKNIEPALQGDIIGGCYTESDFTGDIHRYTHGLSEACAERGVKFNYDSNVFGMNVQEDGVIVTWEHETEGHYTERYDNVVICAGVRSRDFARSVGDRVNIYPVKGYSITINIKDKKSQQAAPWVSLLDDEAKLVLSRLGKDRLRIAGTAEFNGYNRDIRDDRIRPLTKWSERFFPQINTRSVVPWAGLRPMMPNMLPKVGPGKMPGIFYNTGHGHLGWTLAAATAEMVAESIVQSAFKNE